MAIPGGDIEGLSASNTIIAFDPPVTLLRGPIPAGVSDDPSIGPFVLAFRDERSWKSAYRSTESKLMEQCEAGARIGCSISASNKCNFPWWKNLIGASAEDFAERERCEEHEMSACLAASKDLCVQFAKDKCFLPFRDARIALADQKLHFYNLSKIDLKTTNYKAKMLVKEQLDEAPRIGGSWPGQMYAALLLMLEKLQVTVVKLPVAVRPTLCICCSKNDRIKP